MVMSQKRKTLLDMYRREQQTYSPACKTLRDARSMLGISKARMAKKIGIPEEVWIKYENGGVRIPESLMLKIYTFGLDFWCEREE